jgi:DNA-binding MarR family transcriptional regulator
MASRLRSEIKQAKPFRSLRQEALLQLARTHGMLIHGWEQALRPHGITLTQYNVLRILRGAGDIGLPRHEVSSRLLTQVPDVSRLLDRMLRAGLITRSRDESDHRVVNARITEEGLRILEALDEPSYAVADQQLAHMSDADIERLIELLETARAQSPCNAARAHSPAS